MLPRPVVIGLTVLISLVWAGNVVAGYLDPVHHDATINAIFAIVVGAIYGLGRRTDRQKAIRRARKKLADMIEGNGQEDPGGDDE